MADRARPIRRWLTAGHFAAALVAAIALISLGAVLSKAGGMGALGRSDWSALRFTLFQAFLSALFSVLCAVPLARALARRRFRLRGLLITLMGAPFIMPVLVAVMGLLAVMGRSGWVSALLGWLDLPPLSIYGLHGVVLAHVFFNLPLATRLILQGWQAMPAEHHRLAATLNFDAGAVARLMERPMLAQVVPGAFALIFLICTTSFTVALLLGGGPKATTLELAIYQAFRFDFDLSHAATLAMLQFGIGLISALAAFLLRPATVSARGLDRAGMIYAPPGTLLRRVDWLVVWLGGLFLILPMGAVVLSGVQGLADVPGSVWAAITRSLLVAGAATLFALALALPMAALAARAVRGALWVEALAYLILSVSPLVIGTGLFLALYPITDPVALALPVTALVNALLALPFVMQALLSDMRQVELSYGALSDHLGLTGWARWRWLLFPRLRRPIGFAAGLAAALSVGDLGVIALFADPEQPTLPLYIYQLMGSYRTNGAAGAVLILLVLSLGLFWILDGWGRRAET